MPGKFFQIGTLNFTFTPFADVLTILWVVVLVNVFQLIDGLHGMVNGVTIASSAIILLLSLKADFIQWIKRWLLCFLQWF